MLGFEKILCFDLGRACGRDADRVTLVAHRDLAVLGSDVGRIVVKQLAKTSAKARWLFCSCHTPSLYSGRKLFCNLKVFLGASGAFIVVVCRSAESGSLGKLNVSGDLCSEDLVAVVLFKLGDYLH